MCVSCREGSDLLNAPVQGCSVEGKQRLRGAGTTAMGSAGAQSPPGTAAVQCDADAQGSCSAILHP